MLVELFKLAHKLDKKAEYDLANEVQEVMNELLRRTSASVEELVILADYFDAQGETALANKFDAMLVQAKKK